MAEARETVEWDRTASVVAKVHNVNCTKRHDMIKDPSKLNPMRQKSKPTVKGSVDELADLMGA